MFKKNSIFIRILMPVIVIMLIQTLLISLVLFANGTITSLQDSAIDALRQSVENRCITLENTMVHNLSNLEKLEGELTAILDNYLHENQILADEVFGNYEHETALLYDISVPLIDALRFTSSTGAFMFFADSYSESPVSFNGLYYRDLDPIATPADYSDIIFLKGFVDIARKDKIQLDSLWNEAFLFSPEYECRWRDYAKPFIAAANNTSLSAANLSYWNSPHFITPSSPLDSNECITYSRPFFYNGKIVAIIGTEMQMTQLSKFFPSSDFDVSKKEGYMLIKYDTNSDSDTELICDIKAITGSYIKRMIGSGNTITLKASDSSGIYTISESGNTENAHAALQPLRLYNVNAPFSNEQWALLAIGVDSSLFESAASVTKGILFSSGIALLIGIILIGFIVQVSTRSIISIADQIKASDEDNPIIVSRSGTYEVALLCSTINTMRDKRRVIESQLREERERYLMALESAADTFIEYDVEQDSFMIYYFEVEHQKPMLSSFVINSFMRSVDEGSICHKQDIMAFKDALRAKTTKPIEVRFLTTIFSHITDTEPDGEYYWMLLKVSYIRDESDELKKVIGIARQITAEKLAENAVIEAARHDSTTGLYNRSYGMHTIENTIHTTIKEQLNFAICVVRVCGFDMLEAHYGRVLSGAMLAQIARHGMLSGVLENDIAVRLDNDEFVFLFPNADKNSVTDRIYTMRKKISDMYLGENTDLHLSLCAGCVLSDSIYDTDDLLNMARVAEQYAEKNADEQITFYDELSVEDKNKEFLCRDNPVSVSLHIDKASIIALTFDLFEHATDIKSVIHILLAILGEMFSLSHIVICSYDADFSASQVSYQWTAEGVLPYPGNIEKVAHEDLAGLEQMLDDNGRLFYNSDSWAEVPDGIKRLLCVRSNEKVNMFGCVMYEGGVQTGRILFKLKNRGMDWEPAQIHSLHEISKIISSHISIEKSNSASRAKSEFLSRMSHEIRTPMNAIIGITHIAKDSLQDMARLEDCLEKIDYSAKHLLALINDVLEMSRIESGKLQIANEKFSLNDFIDGLDTLMRPQIENKKITFQTELKIKHRNVISDEYRLRQVLVNFLGNAVKFTESGGTITLSIEEQGSAGDGHSNYRFSVKDTGIGIRKEDRKTVFKAFEQAESDKNSNKQRYGTGLGLAISGSIVAALGSKIDLISEFGVGSEFFFVLNMALNDADEQVDTETEAVVDYSGYFKGKRILLVEDNEINIEIASYILDEIGFCIDVARNGKEAVDNFFESNYDYYDAILMDIQMPVMDGLTAAREIRKYTSRTDAQTIPIIAMTADAFDEDMKKSIESGMNGHLAKPVDTTKLCSLLKQLLYHS